MDPYHIALFVHITALLAAVGAAALMELITSRRARSATVREALEWHTLAMKTSKTFPVAIAVLVLTGAYMLSAGGAQTWGAGFVSAGLTGAALLLAIGIFLSIKGKALKGRLEQLVDAAPDQAPRQAPNSLIAALTRANHGIALGVVFDMATKPSAGPAFAVLAAFVVVFVAAGYLRRPAASAAEEPTAA